MPRLIGEPIVLSQINQYEITGVHIYLKPAPRCAIEIARGYSEGDELTPVDIVTHPVEGAPMLAAMSTLTSGDTMYNDLRAMLYARCVADGVIPADAVEV